MTVIERNDRVEASMQATGIEVRYGGHCACAPTAAGRATVRSTVRNRRQTAGTRCRATLFQGRSTCLQRTCSQISSFCVPLRQLDHLG